MKDLRKRLLEIQGLLGPIMGAGVVDHARLERARAMLRELREESRAEECQPEKDPDEQI